MEWRRMAMFGILMALAGCTAANSQSGQEGFSDDVAFLEKYTEVVILRDNGGQGQVARRLRGRDVSSRWPRARALAG